MSEPEITGPVAGPVRCRHGGGSDPSEHELAHRRGRPRSVEADAAIIDATLDLIVEEGIGGLSVESIAARARNSSRV